MIEELHKYHELLLSVLRKYVDTCSAVANYYESGDTFSKTSQSVADITAELAFIASCGKKIKQAKATINRAKNSCSAIVPIHALPFETMSHIFQLVLDAQSCYIEKYPKRDESPDISMKSPEVLSHVCSRWRQISLGSPRLWVHIDLIPSGRQSRLSKGPLARGKFFAARAGQLPLHLHIFSGKCAPNNVPLNLNLPSPISTRIGGLELLVNNWFQHTYPRAFENIFTYCAPGTLDQLIITDSRLERGYKLIQARDSTNLTSRGQLNISKQRLEDLLRPLKVLRLSGFYFHWSSKAYHGLVDLQLISKSFETQISIAQSQLAKILAASPGLRQLRLGLNITDLITDGNSDSSIMLNDLELLALYPAFPAQYEALLQMIPPGPELRQVSIYLGGEETLELLGQGTLKLLSSDEFARFMMRSNVTQLYVRYVQGPVFSQLLHLVRITPSVTELSLTRFDIRSDYSSALSVLDKSCLSSAGVDRIRATGSQLDCLKLFDCTASLTGFRQLTEVFPIQKLELEDCCVYTSDLFGGRDECNQDHPELVEMFPAIKFVDSPSQFPRDYWAPWD